jgi:hypothetical protein
MGRRERSKGAERVAIGAAPRSGASVWRAFWPLARWSLDILSSSRWSRRSSNYTSHPSNRSFLFRLVNPDFVTRFFG